MAVQVDPIKPTLKAPGSQRLKLKCDTLLSTSAFNFNLRRYSTGEETGEESAEVVSQLHKVLRPFLLRRLKVGRCRLQLHPRLTLG